MHGKDEFPKIKGTICNIPIAAKNVCNILLRPKVSNQLIVVKLKDHAKYKPVRLHIYPALAF